MLGFSHGIKYLIICETEVASLREAHIIAKNIAQQIHSQGKQEGSAAGLLLPTLMTWAYSIGIHVVEEDNGVHIVEPQNSTHYTHTQNK